MPLEGEPDEHTIEFRHVSMGSATAVVFVDGMKVDEVRGQSFREAYDRVREAYPQAEWDGLDDEGDG